MFTIINAQGDSIGVYWKSERDAEKNRKAGERVSYVQYKSRGQLHNDND